MVTITTTPLTSSFPASYGDLPDALKQMLARLTLADYFTGATVTVADEKALVRDLIAVCGAATTFKAIATHKNDATTYNGGFNNEILSTSAMKNGQAMSLGQELALAMFIRADVPLSSMLAVITYGQLIAYLHDAPAITAANTALTTFNLPSTYVTAAASGTILTTFQAAFQTATQKQFTEFNRTALAGIANIKTAVASDVTTAFSTAFVASSPASGQGTLASSKVLSDLTALLVLPTDATKGNAFALSHIKQYEISSQVKYGLKTSSTNFGVASADYTFTSATSSDDLLYALSVDYMLLNSNAATAVYPNLYNGSAPSNKARAQAWVLTKVTPSTHPVRDFGTLVSKYSKYTVSTTASIAAVAGVAVEEAGVTPPDSIASVTAGSSFTPSSVAGLFGTVDVVAYTTYLIPGTINTTPAFVAGDAVITFTVSSTTGDFALYPINGASVTYNGSTPIIANNGSFNADALINSTSVRRYIADVGGLRVFNAANSTALSVDDYKLLGFSLAELIAAGITVAPATATAAGYSNADIVANFDFASLTTNGTVFTYSQFTDPASDKSDYNRKLIDKYVDLYNSLVASGQNLTWPNLVDARYKVVAAVTAVPSTPVQIYRAVISWFATEMNTNATASASNVAAKTAIPGSSTTFKQSVAFLSSLLPADGSVSLKDLYLVSEAAGITAAKSTTLRSPFSASEILTNFGFTLKELYSITGNYTLWLSSGTTAAAHVAWDATIVVQNVRPDVIFSNANAVSTSYSSTTGYTYTYAATIMQALLPDGKTPLVTYDTTLADFVTSANYSAIPLSTLISLMGETKVLADLKAEFLSGTSAVLTTDATSSPVATYSNMKQVLAVLAAIKATAAFAKKLIGATTGSTTPLTITAGNIASLSALTLSEKRKLFTGIDDAATQYATGTLTKVQFIGLEYTAKEWYDYLSSPLAVSVTVTMYDLLTASKSVTIYDDGFYFETVGTTTTNRALFNKLADRKLIASIWYSDPVLQALYASSSPEDLPQP